MLFSWYYASLFILFRKAIVSNMSYALGQTIDFSALIDGLSKDELQAIMANEDKVNEIISDQDQVL